MRKFWWVGLLGGLLLVACGPTYQPYRPPSPSPIPPLSDGFKLAWEQACGINPLLPPAGMVQVGAVTGVQAGEGVKAAEAQLWATGLVRGLALERWADSQDLDTVVGSGCLETTVSAQTELVAIARAKASGGNVDLEPGSFDKLVVRATTAPEAQAGFKGDWAIEIRGSGPVGLWVVDSKGARSLVGSQLVADGATFSAVYIGHYDSNLGVFIQDALLTCPLGAACP